MPYNATWIEPWMRPLKPRMLKRIKRKSIAVKEPHSISNTIKTPIKTPIKNTIKTKAYLSKKRTSTSRNKSNRRATRVRRISASKNWSKTLGTKI